MALLKRKRSSLNDPMSVVTRFVNACNRHDADGVASCLHPDFDSIQPMYPSRNFRGADQVRRNWQAIFDAEPGFRLTVLRSAAMNDTIWLELHGAGRDAEVAGVFVMGVQGDRIRWARIYSALVEPVPGGVADEPAPGALREAPQYQEEGAPAADSGEVVEEALIAPVLDMDRSGRRRRRSRRGAQQEAAGEAAGGEEAAAPAVDSDQPAADDVDVVHADAAAVDVSDADAVVVVDAAPDVNVTVEVEPGTEAVVVADEAEAPTPADDAQPTPEVVIVAPAQGDDGPRTEAVDMVTVTEEPPPAEPQPEPEPAVEVEVEDAVVSEAPTWEPAPDPAPDPGPPRRLFGRKRS